MDNSLFQKYRKLLDEVPVGSSIVRQTCFHELDIKENRSAQHTYDKYRRLFENASILEYKGLGCYRKAKQLDQYTVTIANLISENEKFLACLGISEKWGNKSSLDLEREKRWRIVWRDSGLTAEDFIKKYNGTINGELYGI